MWGAAWTPQKYLLHPAPTSLPQLPFLRATFPGNGFRGVTYFDFLYLTLNWPLLSPLLSAQGRDNRNGLVQGFLLFLGPSSYLVVMLESQRKIIHGKNTIKNPLNTCEAEKV